MCCSVLFYILYVTVIAGLSFFCKNYGFLNQETIQTTILFDTSALKTVREQWHFLPAHLDGEPVESWVEVSIHFVLAG